MNWSRDYLQELLHGNDPIASVFELANIWSCRPGRSETEPNFGLLPCQYAVQLYLNYQGDVANGGHSQYFLNPVGAYAHETLSALKELGFEKIHDILSQAVAVFPGCRAPADWQERNVVVEGFSDEVFERWAKLDRQLYSLTASHWAPLLKYLQEHESEILERDGS